MTRDPGTPHAHVTRYIYGSATGNLPDNNRNRVVGVKYDNVLRSSYSYDASGRVKSATDLTGPTGLTVGYRYNNLDAPVATLYPDGTIARVEYTASFLPGMVQDRSGRKSYTDYDALKRPVRAQDGMGNSLEMEYDADGNLTGLLDAKGAWTRWSYNVPSRTVTKRYADGKTEMTRHTVQGWIERSTNARGLTTNYGHNGFGQLTAIDYPSLPDVNFSYNALGEVTQVSDGVTALAGGDAHSFSYDNLGRLTGLDGPFAGDEQTFNYDPQERLLSQSVARGVSGGSQSQSYGYDGLGRLSTLTSSGTSGAGVANGAGLFTYNYVANSARLLRLDLPNGSKVEHGYDTLQRLTSVVNKKGTVNLANYAYSFNAPGSPQRDVRTGVTSQLGTDALKKIAYLYDAVDQLTGEEAKEEVTPGTLSPLYKNTFVFDAMGNRTSATRVQGANTTTTTGTPNALNQLTSLSTSVNLGAAQTSALSYDAGGSLTQSTSSSGAQTLYFYDDLDRLVRIENKNAAGVFTGKSEFIYDYASRKSVSADFTWTPNGWNQTSETRRVFDGLDVVQERNDANQVTAQYVRDGNIGGILSRTSLSGHSYFHYDGGGNVVALSDETGALVGRYAYDAFGNTLEAAGARAAENPYRFSTKEHIAGLVDFGYRFYSPGMGRWLNRDPIRENGGVNLYAMVGNSPSNAVDEYGLIGSLETYAEPESFFDKWLDQTLNGLDMLSFFMPQAALGIRGVAGARGIAGRKIFRIAPPAIDKFVSIGQKFCDNITNIKLGGLSLEEGREKLLKQGLIEEISESTGRHWFRDPKTRIPRVAWDPGSKKFPHNHWHKFVPDNRVSASDFKLNDKGLVVNSNSNQAHINSRGDLGKRR